MSAATLLGCSSSPATRGASQSADGSSTTTTAARSRTTSEGSHDTTTTSASKKPHGSSPTSAAIEGGSSTTIPGTRPSTPVAAKGTTTTSGSTTTTAVVSTYQGAGGSEVITTVCKPYSWYWLFDGIIENHSKEPHRYQIFVGFKLSTGKIVDTRVIDTNALAPGASTNWGASGAQRAEHITCTLEHVQTF